MYYSVAYTNGSDQSGIMILQTQQSRAGVDLEKDQHLNSKREFDFIDFNNSSPTTQTCWQDKKWNPITFLTK